MTAAIVEVATIGCRGDRVRAAPSIHRHGQRAGVPCASITLVPGIAQAAFEVGISQVGSRVGRTREHERSVELAGPVATILAARST